MDLPHILAAGGIVVRQDPEQDPEPRIGIVQLRKNKSWVLPKGKLNRKETALDAARREVLEETGHEVSVHEFVGTITYQSRGKPKVVQFWRMQVAGGPARKLMRDVRAVEWLPLAEAVDRLTRPHERIFLENVGPNVLRAAEDVERPRPAKPRRKTQRSRITEPEEPTATKPVAVEPALVVETVELEAVAAPMAAVNEITVPVPAAESPAAQDTAAVRRTWLRRQLLDRLFGYGRRLSG